MADDVTYENLGVNTGGIQADTVIETEQQVGGEHRQVVKVGESASPTGVIFTEIETLLADADWVSDVINIKDYGIVFINVYSDVGSAVNGLLIEESINGTQWGRHDDNYTVPAGKGKNYSVNAYANFLRVSYTNGGSDQGIFELQIKINVGGLSSSHRIQDQIVEEDDASLVKAVITGEDPVGHFHNVKTSHDGFLAITDNSSGLSIAQGNVTGTSFIHKFGSAPDFDTGDNRIDIWDGSEDDTVWEKFIYTYSSTDDVDSIVSESGSDTFDLEIQGLDANYDVVTQVKTLTGQTPVVLDTNLIRVFRLKNVGTSDNVGHVFCYVSGGTVTAGVPQVAADIRAIIQTGNNQTLMAIYTVPAGKTGYMRSFFAGTAGGNRSTNYVIDLFARPFGQVFQLKHKSALVESGTSHWNHIYTEPEIFQEKTDIVIRVQITDNAITGASVSAGFDIVLVDN